MWGDQCTFFLWLNEKWFCRLLPASLHIHQVFFFFTFSTPYLSLNVTAIPAPYAQNVTAIPAPYAQSVLTQCAKGSCGGLGKMSPFLCTICNFSSTFTPSTLPLLDLWPQVHCSLCQRPARGGHMQHKKTNDTRCRLFLLGGHNAMFLRWLLEAQTIWPRSTSYGIFSVWSTRLAGESALVHCLQWPAGKIV